MPKQLNWFVCCVLQEKLQNVCYFPEKLFDDKDLFDSEVIFLSVLWLAIALKIGSNFEHCSNSSDIVLSSKIVRNSVHTRTFSADCKFVANVAQVCTHL